LAESFRLTSAINGKPDQQLNANRLRAGIFPEGLANQTRAAISMGRKYR
jgi:hypothetical protein